MVQNRRMTAIDWIKFWEDFPEPDEVEDVEGLIFRNSSGKWVAVFTMDNQDHRCQIDYNPWTGEQLS